MIRKILLAKVAFSVPGYGASSDGVRLTQVTGREREKGFFSHRIALHLMKGPGDSLTWLYALTGSGGPEYFK